MSLKELLRFIVLLCAFATPFLCLYVAETMFFPFITGKNFAFRILVEVMLGAWALLMFLDATYRPRFSWILGGAGVFLAVIAVADLNGVNPYRSFWSNYERMEGLITHIHLFLYFIITASVFAKEETWKWFFRTSLGVSMLVSIHAFKQLAGHAEIHQGATRLDATFGNATYLAVYALFHAFIAAFLFARDGSKNSLRYLYIPVGIINLVVLYYTQTRGSLLGVIAGAFLIAILIALFEREHVRLRKFAAYGIVSIVALVSLFIVFKDSAVIQRSETLARMASISLDDATTKSRFMIWEMSYEGWKERPILGWGQDNFMYVFAKHYNPKMWNQEPWFDRSHDVFFDWLIAGGILGLLSYLSLFAAALYYLWWSRRGHFSLLERSILTGMLVGYFVHNIFVFDNLTSYIVFFAVLAYLHTLHADPQEAGTQRVKSTDNLEPGDIAIAAVFVVAVTSALVYSVNLKNIEANQDLIRAIRPEGVLVDGPNKTKQIALEEVLSRDLFGTSEGREQLAQLAVQAQDPRLPEEIRGKFHALASEEFRRELERDPNNVRTLSFAAMFHARFGEFEKSLGYFERAIALAPKRQATYIDMSTMFVAAGEYAKAEEVAKAGYELEKENHEAALQYAVALAYQKKAPEAQDVLSSLRDTPQAYDARLLNAYGTTGQYELVVTLVNEKIARGYAVGRDYFALAGGYLELGQTDASIAAINKAISLDPSLKEQGEGLIQQIQAGR